MPFTYLFFGQFLLRKGLVTFEDIYLARMLQKKSNRKIGDLAEERGWLTPGLIEKILVLQEEEPDRFGETAKKHGYLTDKQKGELLNAQKKEYIFFGEALLKLGLISEEQLIENLREFTELKINRQS